jgi:hypothetical protein
MYVCFGKTKNFASLFHKWETVDNTASFIVSLF